MLVEKYARAIAASSLICASVLINQSTCVAGNAAATLIGSYDALGMTDATDVAIQGNYAFLAMDNTGNNQPEFRILDVSSPAHPVVLSSLDFGFAVNKIFVLDNYAYLATNNPNRELVVVDISNKQAPVVVGGLNAPGSSRGLSVSATKVVAGFGTVTTVRISLGLAKNTSAGEYFLINGDNPTNLSILGSVKIGADVQSISALYNTAFLGTSRPTKEFGVFDISNPAALTEVWSYDLVGSSNTIYDIQYSSERVYFVTNNNNSQPDLFVFNVKPIYPGGFPFSATLAGAANLNDNNVGIKVLGDTAYVASKGSTTLLRVLNVSNPASISLVRSYSETNSEARSIAVGLRNVLLATTNNSRELEILDPGVSTLPIADINGDGRISIACFGDSNTQAGISNGQGTPSWCEYMIEDFGNRGLVTGFNLGMGFAGIVNDGRTWFGAPLYADYYVGNNFANHNYDVVIAAYGTNDIRARNTPQATLDAYTAFTAESQSFGIPAYVALTPVDYSNSADIQQKMLDLNQLIQGAYPPSAIVDFYSGFKFPEDYLDTGLHFNASGEAKRGMRAYQTIAP